MFNLSRSTARLLVVAPFAALLAAACEHNDGPVIPVAGQLLTITVTPNPGSAQIGNTIQYAAAGQDVNGAAVTIPPPLVWANLNATAGTINSSSGLFTAGTTVGTYNNTIRAQSGNIAGFAGAIVTSAPAPILGRAATYGILAGSTVTCAGAPDSIKADVGIFPGTAITGPCSITGAQNLGNALADSAQQDLTVAYNYLAGLPCGTVVTPADLGGRTLAPGVYCVASSMAVTGTVTLAGPASGVWVFQMGSTLTTATSAVIALSGGALARNVWWQVGSSATLGNGTTFRGNVVAFTTISLNNTVAMTGRALARNGAVTMGTGSVITLP
jgi:hypothetical protein